MLNNKLAHRLKTHRKTSSLEHEALTVLVKLIDTSAGPKP